MYKTWDMRNELLALHRGLGSWRAVAAHVGCYSAGYWAGITTGTIRPSRRAENALRRRLGLPPRGVTRVADMPTRELTWYLAHRRPMH
jgi:hypothetical protein